MSWLKSHWRAAGGAITVLASLWQGIRALLAIGGEIDFVVSKAEDPSWLSWLWFVVVAPPPWLTIPLILIGLFLIYWDVARARDNTKPPEGKRQPASLARTAASAVEVPSERSSGSTAEAWLVSLRDSMPLGTAAEIRRGDRSRNLDYYISMYNERAGHVSLSIRRDKIGDRPYIHIARNEKRGGKKEEVGSFDIKQVEAAVSTYLKVMKEGGYVSSTSGTNH